MSKYMSQIPPEPKPKAGPRKSKPKPAKAKKIDFTSAISTPKRASKDARTKMEMPKKVKPNSGKVDLNKYEMPKVMGSTKAQRANSAREMLNDMRSRNLLRAKKKNK